MSREIELEYDDHTLIFAELTHEQSMYEHRHGLDYGTVPKLAGIRVLTYIGGTEYDVTRSFTQKEMKYFEEWTEDELKRRELWD